MPKFMRAKIAGVVSVLVDFEQDPSRKNELTKLMCSLRSSSNLNEHELALLKEIDVNFV